LCLARHWGQKNRKSAEYINLLERRLSVWRSPAPADRLARQVTYRTRGYTVGY